MKADGYIDMICEGAHPGRNEKPGKRSGSCFQTG
jgi:hypothetical protein